MNKLNFILLIGALLALFLVWQWWRQHRRQIQRQQLFALATPEKWVQHIQRNVAIFNHLPAELQQQLLGHVNVFLSEKYFSGHGGLEITDEIRVTIAAQACLLLLNRKTNYFKHLKTIMVYPAGFKHPDRNDHGHHLGESWVRGPVVLSWNDSRHGGVNAKDGSNVVIHEFAHQLDQLDGAGDGRPPFEPPLNHEFLRTWGLVMRKEFTQLVKQAKLNQRSLFNHYGATNPAEFFAVTTEHFFEQPRTFKRKHPELYTLLVDYYRLDPANWVKPPQKS